MTLRAWEECFQAPGSFCTDSPGEQVACSLQQDWCPRNGGGTGYCAQMKPTQDGRQAAPEQESNPDPGLGTSNCNRPDRQPQVSAWIVWVESYEVFP